MEEATRSQVTHKKTPRFLQMVSLQDNLSGAFSHDELYNFFADTPDLWLYTVKARSRA